MPIRLKANMSRYPVSLVPLFCLAPHAAFSQGTEPTQLPKVVVTAPSPAQETRKQLEAEQALIPGGVTLIDSQDTKQRQISNLSDLMRFVPGVWSTSSSGGDAAFLSIRGSNLDATNYDMNGVKLLQDGLPVTTADGNNHNRLIDPIAARYATVARGANALTYGASTLGGAIDFTTPTALDSPPLELVLNGGSFGLAQAQFNAGAVSGNVDGMLTLDAKHWDGYRQHSSQERTSLYGNVGWQIGSAVRTRLFLSTINNKEELPGALTRDQWQQDPRQANAAAVTGNYQINVETQRIANKTTWDIDADSSLSFGVSYEQQSLYHPIVQSPFFSLLIDTTQRNLGTSLNYNLRLGEHNLLAGLNYGYTTVRGGNYSQSGGSATAQTQDVDNRADLIELFVVDRWQFAPRWTAVYGAQAIDTSRDVRTTTLGTGTVVNPKGDYNSINPRVGLIHQLTPEVELFTNLSRLYEPPTNFELEDDATPGAQPLEAMHGAVVEVGTRGNLLSGGTRWRWDVSAYYARLHDEILSRDDPLAPGTSLTANVDDTIHAGIEALLGASFPFDAFGKGRLEPLVSLTFNRFRFKDDSDYGNNSLPAAPDYAIRAELIYRDASGFFAGPTFDFVGRRYADFNNTYKVDGYNLFGLRAGVTQKNWEVFGEIRNLGDKNYIAYHSVKDTAGAGDAVLYPGEPRSLYVGARLRF
jgi:iron complex outermembrane receptor protein